MYANVYLWMHTPMRSTTTPVLREHLSEQKPNKIKKKLNAFAIKKAKRMEFLVFKKNTIWRNTLDFFPLLSS